MRKKEDSPILLNSDPISKKIKPFIDKKEKKIPLVSNLFNTSNDSIINNSNNDIIDLEDDYDDDIDDINEENIYDKSIIGDQHLLTPINETHRMLSNKNRFGKTYIDSIPLKRIMVPRSKSPNIRNHRNIKNKNAFKNAYDNLSKNEIFSSNNDFLHCRNCMLIVALNRYGKFYFNK